MGAYIHSIIIAVVYFIIKYSEMRIKRVDKPMEELFKDSVIVFISTIVGLYVITFGYHPIMTQLLLLFLPINLTFK